VILLNRTCFGKLDNDTAYYPQVKFSEQVPALVLAATIFFLGIQPTWLVRWSETTTNAMVAAVQVNVDRQLANEIFDGNQARKSPPVFAAVKQKL
jgi:NAD(P)H-quinone oxidoreductase subunit 4